MKDKKSPSVGVDVVRRSDLTNIKMVAGNEKKYSKVIDDGQIIEWVGIGWITYDGKLNGKKYPTVVD